MLPPPPRMKTPCRGGWGLASLNDLTGRPELYVPGRAPQAGQAVRQKPDKADELVLQEWWFCGWTGKPPKENKVLISKDAQPRISADHMTKDLARKKKNDSPTCFGAYFF
jgi:hypothetical protein